MEFNINKCAIIDISNSPNKKRFDYTMNGEILETVKHHPYFGVELSDNPSITPILITSQAKLRRYLYSSNAT